MFSKVANMKISAHVLLQGRLKIFKDFLHISLERVEDPYACNVTEVGVQSKSGNDTFSKKRLYSF